MNPNRAVALPAIALAIAACGDGSGPGTAVLDCDAVAPTTLAPGQVALADASQTACLRLTGSSAGAEYLYVAYSAAGTESVQGTGAEYRLDGSAGTTPAAVTRGHGLSDEARGSAGTRFHDRLREIGRDLARQRRSSGASSVRAAKAPPTVGETRTFNVLRSADVPGTDPDDFVQVEGTARYVGAKVAIFLDNAAPTEGGYTQDDLDAIGSLFDDHLYPIDVAAFGAETDVNGDDVVLVLLTERVTRLAGCLGGQVVVGYFFAVDLFGDMAGSNDAEIFYGLAPDVSCGVDRQDAVRRLPGVFVHEFQHMINYGQKVIAREGEAEDTWLDEGLAGYAEELGGRLVPDERCVDEDCLTQFQFDNIANAYEYLFAPGDAYLIGPRQPPLPLTQYGADWLFVRWLVDHFADEQPNGADFTRALVQTTRTGSNNVATAAGVPFDRLVGEWQLANYLDQHPEFQDLTGGTRFEYPSWDLRAVYQSFHQEDPADFPRAYPLLPDAFDGSAYTRTGALRAGSGQHVLIETAAGAEADLLLTDPDGDALPPTLVPRTVVLRLR